jgi:hypothetical protein
MLLDFLSSTLLSCCTVCMSDRQSDVDLHFPDGVVAILHFLDLV